jgi:hypothetical protein
MKIKDIKVMIREAMDDTVLLAKPTTLFEANYGRAKRKIEIEMVSFVMITAFRGDLSRRENIVKQGKLEEYVAGAGFPWTKMPGSGTVEDPPSPEESAAEVEVDAAKLAEDIEVEAEEEIEPVEEEPEDIEVEAEEEIEPAEEEPEGIEVKENSILIWEQTRPDKGERGELGLSLFELAKFLAKKYNQDSFIFGEPVKSERTGKQQMLIKLYDRLGDPIQEPWAGPWSTLTQINDDDIFWSSIGSKRAKLTELLNKYRQLPVRSKMDAMKKQHYLDTVKSALKKFQ